MASESILRVNAVDKAFGGIHAVDRCSLTVLPQSITGLIGPNGAGKHTLFNIVAGLYRPDGENAIRRPKETSRTLASLDVGPGARPPRRTGRGSESGLDREPHGPDRETPAGREDVLPD